MVYNIIVIVVSLFQKKNDNVILSLATTESSGITRSTTKQRQTEEVRLAEAVSSSKDNVLTTQETLSPPFDFNIAKTDILVIERKYGERTKDGFVTMEFQKAAASLCAHFENIGDYEPRSEQSHILEILTKNCKEHQTVVIFCNICAEILESGSSSEYPGIPTQHIEPLTTMLFVLVNCSDNNDDMSSIISKQSNFLRTVTKKLQQWTIPHFSEIDMKVTVE